MSTKFESLNNRVPYMAQLFLIKINMKKIHSIFLVFILLFPTISIAQGTIDYQPLLPGLTLLSIGAIAYCGLVYLWFFYILVKLSQLKKFEEGARKAFIESQSIRKAVERIEPNSPYKIYSVKLLQAFDLYPSVKNQITFGGWLHRKSNVAQKSFKKMVINPLEHAKNLVKLPTHFGFLVMLYFIYHILKSPYAPHRMYQMMMESFVFLVVCALITYLIKPTVYIIKKQIDARIEQFDIFLESMNDLYMSSSNQNFKTVQSTVQVKKIGTGNI